MFRSLEIFLCSFALLSAEPSCSRFHYEEQTLRKMIMVEMLVEKFKVDNEGAKGTVQDTLAEISTERAESKNKIEEFMTIVTNMENSLKEKQNRQDIIQFSARGLKTKSPSYKETFIFTTIMSNNSSGYNKETGVFTAPVGGLYMFNLQLCILRKSYIYFEIVSNEQAISRGLASNGSSKWGICNSYSVSVLLNAHDTVMVQAGSATRESLWEDDSAWNRFDGFLIQKN